MSFDLNIFQTGWKKANKFIFIYVFLTSHSIQKLINQASLHKIGVFVL